MRRFHTLDVFTDRAYGGNPLAVVSDAGGLSTAAMQAIAREFNLSETVFILPPESPANTRRVRIFTPGCELPFAGHPTIGTAWLLALLGEVPLREPETEILLEEGVGVVRVQVRVEGGRPVMAHLTPARLPEQGPPPPPRTELAR
ncbi:MAG TPA: PhzF family phenazine biosynthesis isomerase, partial [Longimicrobiaceae bacterium]|nr:PhzF family phenazine biosynthesis isomerase [Longimicrobiaceae bacterium]